MIERQREEENKESFEIIEREKGRDRKRGVYKL
jgi:hypothetical protein